MLFGFKLLESIFISKIEFERSEIFLLFVRITFREIIKYKSLYLKINSNQINFTKSILQKQDQTYYKSCTIFFFGAASLIPFSIWYTTTRVIYSVNKY